MTERQNEIARLGARLDPELRSWITSVLIPAMVHEYIAEHGTPNSVAGPIGAVSQCDANGRLSAEGIQ